jgi:hypothetical protein
MMHNSPYAPRGDVSTLYPSQDHAPQQQRPLNQATEVAVHLLRRITRVSVQPVVIRDGHRDCVLQVTRQSHAKQPTIYQLRHRYSALRDLRAQLIDRTQDGPQASTGCVVCARLTDTLMLDHNEPGLMRQLTGAMSHEAPRLEKFFSAVLEHAVLFASANAPHCERCENTILLIAAILKEPYYPSTGLI